MALPRKDPPPRATIRRSRSIPRFPLIDKETVSDSLKPRDKMEGFRVLAHVHLYPPVHNAGAEWMLHALLRYGAEQRGWSVQVITDHPPARSDSFQGIKVRHDKNANTVGMEYRFANVVITHLDVTRKAMEMSARHGRPLVHLIHNHAQLAYHRVERRWCALAVFNSKWIQDLVTWDGPQVILHPPTRVADYEISESAGEKVSLLNLSEAKGAPTFYAVAEKNPGYSFLGVRGSYGHQVDPPEGLENVEVVENNPDVKDLYAQTKVLLVPSHYESWGRVAVEAACSGIPSICSPTPGLLEAAVAADYCEPDDISDWNRSLRLLMNSPGVWEEASAAAKQRALELDKLVDEQLQETAEMIESL